MIRRLLIAFVVLLLVPGAAQAQDDLARQTAKVEDLRSIREIKRLQAQWGYLALAGDWKGMAALGTDDVRMVLPNGDAVGRTGLEQLREPRIVQCVTVIIRMQTNAAHFESFMAAANVVFPIGERRVNRAEGA